MNLKLLFVSFLHRILLILSTTIFLSSCSVYKIQEIEPIDINERWIILPMQNHSDTPEAGARAADIAATLLRTQGIKQLSTYIPAANDKSLAELDQQKVLNEAINWANKKGYRFGFGGSVQEWRYKSGLDGDPAAGITLTVTDLKNNQIIWSASGSSTGWGRESVSGVAHKVMAKLIDGLTLSD